jgi:AraC-like DNA-binding protein
MAISQADINRAFTRLIADGDDTAWQHVLDAVRAGEVSVQQQANALILRARPKAQNLAQALQQLRLEADSPTIAALAEQVGLSTATVQRILVGQVTSTWPTIKALIEALGGNPQDYRDLYAATRAKRRPAP